MAPTPGSGAAPRSARLGTSPIFTASAWHERHNADLAEIRGRCAPGGLGLDFLLLGDSITEGWKKWFPEFFRERFGRGAYAAV